MEPRYIFRLLTAFFLRFRFILVAGIFLGLFFFIVLRLLGTISVSSKIERIGIEGEYSSSNLPGSVSDFITSGLTKISEDGSATGAIAKSWEAKDGGKTWIFHLDENARWQDGTKVASKDIKYNFDDVEVSYPDEATIVFKLKLPFSPFPNVLSRPVFKTGLLGTGEWRVTDVSLVGSFIEKLTVKDKNGDTKLFKFYPSDEDLKLAFQLGEVDSIGDIFNPKPFDTWKTVDLMEKIDEHKLVLVFFNTDNPNLSDKSVREALSYAIDKESLINGSEKGLLGGERAYGPISATSWGYNSQTRQYDLDTKKAKDLIANSKIDNEAKKNLKIKLSVNSDLLSVAEKIVKDWKAIGIGASVQVVSFVPREFDAYLAILTIPTDPDQYTTWHSTETANNLSNYKNIRIDKLLEDGRLELNQESRKKIYLDFQRFLVEDAPAAFLYHPYSYSVSR